MSKTKRILLAFLVGLFSLPLLFLLAEGVAIPSSIPAAELIHRGIFIFGMGSYFLIAAYLLSQRDPQVVRNDWPTIVALSLTLTVTAAIALAVEPDKSAAMEAAGIALLAVASSFAGSALAARAARH
ncbi:MAG: hypothetical protein Q8L35_00745 [Actinomycetota bacterium]|nr:hypothetical protein [Actinomycetota bacterium]